MGLDRLSPLDVSFLYFDSRTTPMHAGGILVFDPPESGEPVTFEQVMALLRDRLSTVPRLRQRVKWVPGNLASPVWVDDRRFDLSYHVRRSALPRPGGEEQLVDLAARLMERPLDTSRPLWELYFVEGLGGDRVAVIGKTHHAMVDGVAAVDTMALLLDVTPEPRTVDDEHWEPRPEPSAVRMVGSAVTDWVRRPAAVADTLEVRALDVRVIGSKVATAASGIAAAVGTVSQPPPDSPLNERTSAHRRVALARTSLSDYREIKQAFGGTVNDVVLAVCTNALRNWLLTRGEPVTLRSALRAMVPVSVRGAQSAAGGNYVASYFVDLPVGEHDPVVQLHRVSYEMKGHKEAGQQVGAQALTRLAGFSPPTLHALGARVAISTTNRLFNLVITNVPGPQFPLYMHGTRMQAVFPMVPLTAATNLAIGVTSYDGGVFYGLNADREALPDVDVIGDLIEQSLEELRERMR